MSATPADLLAATRAALEGYVELTVDDDGSLALRHADVLCVVQAVELAPGLVVLSTTCVLAWDLPVGPRLVASALAAGEAVQFGGIGVGERDGLADVTLRYAFPAAGLGTEALRNLLLLVLSGASRARTDTLAGL